MLQALEVAVGGAAWRRLTRLAVHTLAVAALVLVGGAPFAARTLPQDAKFGRLTQFSHPYAVIGSKKLRLNAAARIYNEHNLIIMPVAMRQQAKVLYKLDWAGHLSAMWLLTPEEAAAFEKGFNKPAPDASKPPEQGRTTAPPGTKP